MMFTNRKDFPKVLASQKTQYCWVCHEPGAQKQGTTHVTYFCNACHKSSERVLIHDPNMQSSFDDEGRLIHESCGVFIARSDKKILLFKRTKFPFLLTIPAGHLEQGEKPMLAAIRETEEEVGLRLEKVTSFFKGNIEGDECLGGADIHHWNAYLATVEDGVDITLDEEGESWGWYDSNTLSLENTVQPVVYMLQAVGARDLF